MCFHHIVKYLHRIYRDSSGNNNGRVEVRVFLVLPSKREQLPSVPIVSVAFVVKHVINIAIITRTRNVRACWTMSDIYATCFAEMTVGNGLDTSYDL